MQLRNDNLSSRRFRGVRRRQQGVAIVGWLIGMLLATQSACEWEPGCCWLEHHWLRLAVDGNHDGVVDLWDESDRGEALFLPNVDDDSSRCQLPEDLFTHDGEDRSFDRQLATCNDAADEIVNGESDLADMAQVLSAPMDDAPDGAQLVVEGAPAEAVRVFIRDQDGFRVFDTVSETVPRQMLLKGLDLRIEGRDVLRDSSWDGTVKLSLRLPDGCMDTVYLRQAPVLLQNNLQSLQQVVITNPPAPMTKEELLAEIGDNSFYTYEMYLEEYDRMFGNPFKAFRDTLDAARVAAAVEAPLKKVDSDGDRWAQDLFEPAYASMPGPGGQPHVMRVLIRTASLRPSARSIFTLRGPDVGVVHQSSDTPPDTVFDSMNNMGNVEALPPYTVKGVGYPAGRILIGTGPDATPDPSFVAMLAAQTAQPILEVDTSWLCIGHVDEIVHVLPSRNGRGWTIAVPDPRMALRILQDVQASGHGSTTLFTGRTFNPFVLDGGQAEISVDDVLSNQDLLAANERAAGYLDQVIARLLQETGLDESDLVRLPVLYKKMDLGTPVDMLTSRDASRDKKTRMLQKMMAINPGVLSAKAGDISTRENLTAFTPNLVNGLLLSNSVFAYTQPQGPVVNGEDLFAQAAALALAGVGVRPADVDTWDWVHVGAGEVHCATNVLRDPGQDAAWWRVVNNTHLVFSPVYPNLFKNLFGSF